ncbi:YigZ family protein [Nocardioides sambongensis]|uniref:YigZ family protein n=1 Tax=Nocardioides sambongensis TaxID=2589074 RepID=UPI0022ABAC32|nr:YigZ family protein [Nocardioides sambongensis]
MERASDDGEPAGTAGAPMLEVLRGAGLSDVVAVVTRWFGGTLLGAGGLVRAYGDAVRAAVADAGAVRRSLVVEHELVLDHADAGRVESELRARGVAVLGADYAERVALRLGVGDGEEQRVAAVVAELTAGASGLRVVGRSWADAPEHPAGP